MALATIGTNANNSLSAIVYGAGDADADVASVALGILDDQNVTHPVYPGAFSKQGLLYIPNRGYLKPLPGDYIAFDAATGWPILISARAATAGPYTHNP